MIQKLIGMVAVCGLALSVSAMSPKATSAAKPERALSATKMQKTTGAGGYTCSKAICGGTNGCAGDVDWTYYPKTGCEQDGSYFTYSVCNDFAQGDCSTEVHYFAGGCVTKLPTDVDWERTNPTRYCGT